MLQKARYIINHKILSKFGKRESSPLARSMKLSATIVARIWVYAKKRYINSTYSSTISL